MFAVLNRPAKSASGTSSEIHDSVASAGVVVAENVTSCSESSPPPNASSAPKSTSFTRNTAGASVASGVQMSMRKRVMFDASIVDDENSTPANTRSE